LIFRHIGLARQGLTALPFLVSIAGHWQLCVELSPGGGDGLIIY